MLLVPSFMVEFDWKAKEVEQAKRNRHAETTKANSVLLFI